MLPKPVAVDNGPEFVSKALDAWAYRNRAQREFSPPGKPSDNTFAGSCNGHVRAGCSDRHRFASAEEAR
ncbi:MAG: integrase core domain-containing protein [Actinomycetota bacterium]